MRLRKCSEQLLPTSRLHVMVRRQSCRRVVTLQNSFERTSCTLLKSSCGSSRVAVLTCLSRLRGLVSAGLEPTAAGSSGSEGSRRRSPGVSFVAARPSTNLLHSLRIARCKLRCLRSCRIVHQQCWGKCCSWCSAGRARRQSHCLPGAVPNAAVSTRRWRPPASTAAIAASRSVYVCLQQDNHYCD